MNYRTLVMTGASALALTAAACTSGVDTSALRPFAFIDVRELPATNSTGLGAFASAIFVRDRVTGIIPSGSLAESCSPASLIPTQDAGNVATGANLDPGTVSMTLRGSVDHTARTVPLTATTASGGLLRYTNSSSPALSGGTDSATFEIQGQAGGFPAFTVKSPTVAPFVAQPVDDSIVGQGIRVQWTAAAAAGTTRMQISLQFGDATSSTPNMEVRCIALDDGDFTIPRQYLSEWQDAGVDASHKPHQVVMSRFNTVGANIADGIAAVVMRIDTTMVK